jgi:hypothetical protein
MAIRINGKSLNSEKKNEITPKRVTSSFIMEGLEGREEFNRAWAGLASSPGPTFNL